MNATQIKSLQPDSMTNSGQSHRDDAPQSRPAEKKAVMGSGVIIPPAVAAHLRRKTAETGLRTSAERKAVMGSGVIIPPSVAAHLRRKMADAGKGSI